ncbi:type I restriction-modification system subunit M N-terminal domain-containing protein [Staphylococcus aureus]
MQRPGITCLLLKQRQQQAELHKKLWSIAKLLRGTWMRVNSVINILGLIFYRFLSEAEQEYADALSGEDITYQEDGTRYCTQKSRIN